MPNRVATFNTFAGSAPPWSLPNLDANFSSIASAFNDSSLGYNNYIGTDGGGANAYVVSCTFGVPVSYNVGMTLTFKPANTNTGASTINVNSLGTMPIQHGDGTACIGGEIQANKNISLIYNGTAFQIQGPPFLYGTNFYYDYDDFIFFPGGTNVAANGASKLFFLSGAGTAVSFTPMVVAGHPGVLQIVCGTTSNQSVRAYSSGAVSLDAFTYTLRWIMSTGVVINTAQVFLGLNSNFSSFLGAANNEVGFYGSAGSGFWQMVTANGTTQTVAPTTAPISASTWYDLMIVANTAGATFYVNGTQVGTQSATMPGSTSSMNIGAMIVSQGTNTGAFLDLFEIMITGIPILSGSILPRFAHGYV